MLTAGQKVRTRGGMTVEIIAVLPKPDCMDQQIVGLLHSSDGPELTLWGAGGVFHRNGTRSGLDLMTGPTLVPLPSEVQFK